MLKKILSILSRVSKTFAALIIVFLVGTALAYILRASFSQWSDFAKFCMGGMTLRGTLGSEIMGKTNAVQESIKNTVAGDTDNELASLGNKVSS